MPRFSETVMDHFQAPRNEGRMAASRMSGDRTPAGRIDEPVRTGIAGHPGRGRTLVLSLRIDDERVVEATFQSHGCGATIACGSMLTELVTGRSLDDCRSLTAGDLLEALDGLPPDKKHCADFAMLALRNALNQNTDAGGEQNGASGATPPVGVEE